MGDPEIVRNAELNLADCYLALGRLDEAQRLLETVERESRRQGTWGEDWMKWRYTQHLHASLGEFWLARGDPAQALSTSRMPAWPPPTASNSRRNIVKGRRLKGKALLAQGNVRAAETELEEALHVARYVGNPYQLRTTLAALARLRRAQGRARRPWPPTRGARRRRTRRAGPLRPGPARDAAGLAPGFEPSGYGRPALAATLRRPVQITRPPARSSEGPARVRMRACR